ncbi:MAG: hypothetical protein IJ091_07915 [Oscillospiraceae bacterium]|nr:hypothetical protein [Oscillospiraceae bacterium]
MAEQYTPHTDPSVAPVDTQTAVLQTLRQQNELLAQQNQMLRELIAKTPDRNEINAGFSEQRKHLELISKTQQTEYIWSWAKFVLLVIAAIAVCYGLYRIWSYFSVLNQTISQYAEKFSSAFGGMEETLGELDSIFSKFKEFFRIG